MSWRASGEAKKITKGAHGEKLRHADKLALLIISDDYIEHLGYASTSQVLLAKECLCSERTLIRLTQRLERFGLVSVEHRGRLGNRYSLTFMPDWHQSAQALVTTDELICDKNEQLGDTYLSHRTIGQEGRSKAELAKQLLRKCSKCGFEALSLSGHSCVRPIRGYQRPAAIVRTYEQTQRESATERRAREASEQVARLAATVQARRDRRTGG